MIPRNAPGGCGLCGIEQRGHGRQYRWPDGWHQWQPPTQQQIKNRMLARRAEKEEPVPEMLIDPPCGECGHPRSRHSERDEPRIPNPAECEDCTGPGQPWRHEFLPVEVDDDADVCRAARYADLADSYNGSSLCGCPNCVEYVAERESEDEV